MCYLPGLEPRRWPCIYRGSEGARCWWGWWVLVSGAVVSRVVLQGGVRSVMGVLLRLPLLMGLFLSWRHFGSQTRPSADLNGHW